MQQGGISIGARTRKEKEEFRNDGTPKKGKRGEQTKKEGGGEKKDYHKMKSLEKGKEGSRSKVLKKAQGERKRESYEEEKGRGRLLPLPRNKFTTTHYPLGKRRKRKETPSWRRGPPTLYA